MSRASCVASWRCATGVTPSRFGRSTTCRPSCRCRKASGALLHNSGRLQQFSIPPTESEDAHGRGHAQLGHAIEHCAFYPCFRALRLQAPRPEPSPEHLLEPEHRILSDTLPRTPAERPPRRAAMDGNLLEDT